MLKIIHGKPLEMEDPEILYMKDAAWPVPFQPGLEYNSPAHGTWNIVHTGMLIPGSHQIYVCAANCNRGVVLTAAEMNATDRFSSIALCEEDLIDGNMEELVIDGVTDILERLERKPTVVLLFTVCLHHFMGCDLEYIYRTLRERFPDQRFVDCYMDPIMQKGGLTPDQKLRIGLYSCLEERKKNPKQVNIIGNDLPTEPDSEMLQFLKQMGYTVKDITTCKDFDEYLSMSESFLNLSFYPPAKVGADQLSERLGMKHLYLPNSFDYEKIDWNLEILANMLNTEAPETANLKEKCERKLAEAKSLIGNTPIALDATAVPALLSLTKLLLTHGFHVVRIYTDSFSTEEKAEYKWLQKNAPNLTVCATIHPKMRVFLRGQEEKLLAIGQKAAYFHQTPYFVNMVEGGGLYGYEGICRLMDWLMEAFMKPKDTKDLVIRKGLGCESCI